MDESTGNVADYRATAGSNLQMLHYSNRPALSSIQINHTKGIIMEDFKQRVVDEHRDLWTKSVALQGFTLTDEFKELPESEKSRLFRQFKIMDLYADVLIERIGNF